MFFVFTDDIGLHRVENPSHTDKAVTLHLYSPPFDECYCFDQRTGKKLTAKVTFWSKFGKRTPFVSDAYFHLFPSSHEINANVDNTKIKIMNILSKQYRLVMY